MALKALPLPSPRRPGVSRTVLTADNPGQLVFTLATIFGRRR